LLKRLATDDPLA
jgi:hypothetical protein